MQKMLDRLYYEGFDWGDPPKSPEYRKAKENLENLYRKLMCVLGEENQALLNQFSEAKSDVFTLECRQSFAEGFRMGAGLLIDVLYPGK